MHCLKYIIFEIYFIIYSTYFKNDLFSIKNIYNELYYVNLITCFIYEFSVLFNVDWYSRFIYFYKLNLFIKYLIAFIDKN